MNAPTQVVFSIEAFWLFQNLPRLKPQPNNTGLEKTPRLLAAERLAGQGIRNSRVIQEQARSGVLLGRFEARRLRKHGLLWASERGYHLSGLGV